MSDGRAKCRWGFLGASTIGRKNWLSLRNSGNGVLTKVASRELARANQFIDFCQPRHPFETPPQGVAGYQAILDDPDIDAVYIPLPTGLRKQWVIQAARAGKHVLCEKPCAVEYQDLVEMTAACAEQGVQFMDGVMFMHSLRLPMMRQAVDHKIGQLRRMTSQFCFHGDEQFQANNIRVDGDMEPAGCLGDLGWYDIRLSLWAMNFQMPVQVQGRIVQGIAANNSWGQVPLQFTGWLKYDHGVESSFYCSFVTAMTQWANLTGTEGEVRLTDFALPLHGHDPSFDLVCSNFDNATCQFQMHQNSQTFSVNEPSDSLPDSQESKMFRTFSDLVSRGKPDLFWPMVALKTQQVMNALFRSATVGRCLHWVDGQYQET